MKIAIRADGSSDIGSGHLARTISLAIALQRMGADAFLATKVGGPARLLDSADVRTVILRRRVQSGHSAE